MKFTLEINMDNAAFIDDPFELGRILRKLASFYDANGAQYQEVMDINGNVVGQATITED